MIQGQIKSFDRSHARPGVLFACGLHMMVSFGCLVLCQLPASGAGRMEVIFYQWDTMWARGFVQGAISRIEAGSKAMNNGKFWFRHRHS